MYTPRQMAVDDVAWPVPLDGFVMQVRRSELESVAAGLGEFDSSEEGDLITLVRALQCLPPLDRAPAWELAVRRYGRRKPLVQAAGEIGMDVVHARDLLERLAHCLAAVPPPEHVGNDPAAETVGNDPGILRGEPPRGNP